MIQIVSAPPCFTRALATWRVASKQLKSDDFSKILRLTTLHHHGMRPDQFGSFSFAKVHVSTHGLDTCFYHSKIISLQLCMLKNLNFHDFQAF